MLKKYWLDTPTNGSLGRYTYGIDKKQWVLNHEK